MHHFVLNKEQMMPAETKKPAEEIVIDGIDRVVLELKYDGDEKRDRIWLLASDKDGHIVREVLISGSVSPLDGAVLLSML